MAATEAKSERIDFRTTDHVKEVIQRAADLLGTTMSAFVAQRSYEAAKEVLADQATIALSDCDRDRFLALLGSPPKPNTALKSLLKNS